MRRYAISILPLVFALVNWGCSDPAANKPQANVSAPQQETGATGATEHLKISPENSKVEFVASKVTRSHNGSFKQFSGTIDLVPNSLENSKVTIDIDTNSVEADDPGLTRHLMTPDFFDVTKFPKANFSSTKIEAGNAQSATHTVTGNFDLHGVKKSINFPATIAATATEVTVNSEFSINRKDFALVYPGKADDLINDRVVIRLSLKVPRK